MENDRQEAAEIKKVDNVDFLAATEKQEVIEDNPQKVNEEKESVEVKVGEVLPAKKKRIKSRLSREKKRENFQFYKSIDYSGFIERLFARGVDFLIVLGFGYLMYREFGLTKAIIGSLIFDIFARIILTYFFGATVGKFIFGTRVISRCSRKLSIHQVIIRELSKYISGFMFNMGYISIIVSRRKRAWHDIIACTAVTSGGRDEALYAKEIYNERPEKWHVYIAAPLIVIFTAFLLFSVNQGSDYLVNQVGMIGFIKATDSKGVEFKYNIPSSSVGIAGVNKNIIQAGDIDGDRGIELFKEGISEGKIVINTLRITATRPVDGDVGIVCDKPVIQYRLIDIDGDKKDELAVLYEDRTLKLYNLNGETAELSSIGPVQLNEITAFVKGRESNVGPYKLFIAGDKNKLSVITMKDGKMEEQKFELPGDNNIVSFDTGIFQGKHYLVGATDDQKLVFYSLEGDKYIKDRELVMTVKERAAITVRDLDCDGINEVFIMSPANDEGSNHILCAYDVSGNTMKLKWDGGEYYKYMDNKLSLVIDDGGDIDNDGKLEVYMVGRRVSGQEGSAHLIVFEGNKYLLMLNDLLRTLALASP